MDAKADFYFRTIARGLLIKGDKLLFAKDKHSGHYFPPGGGVEPNESVVTALHREIEEELGWKIQVEKFVGCLEHRWEYVRKQDQKKISMYEMNHYFLINSIEAKDPPVSKEEHIEFHWVPVEKLETIGVLPDMLPALLKRGVESALASGPAFWSSTVCDRSL